MKVLSRKILYLRTPGLPQVVPVLAVLMEVFWAYAWLVWVSSWPALGWDGTPLLLISGLLLAVFTEIVARLALARNWPLRRVRLVVLSSSLVLLLILVRASWGGGYDLWDAGWFSYVGRYLAPLVTALVFGVFLVWRGIIAGSRKFAFQELYNRFILGMVAVVILLVIWGIAGNVGQVWSSIGGYIVLFFGVGLLALATANLETLRQELLKHKEDISSFNRRWLSILVVMVLAILGLSVVLASIFSSNIWESLLRAFSILGDWLLIVLTYALFPIVYLFAGIIYLFKLIMSWLNGNQEPQKLEPPDFSQVQKAAQDPTGLNIPVWVILALKWGAVAILVGLVIFFLARTLMRYWEAKTEKDVDEEHENLWSWGLFTGDLRIFLAWLFRWAWRKKTVSAHSSGPPPAALIDGDKTDRLFNIRELYRALLWQGCQAGTPRNKSETPSEYRSRLEDRMAEARDEIEGLTEAYIYERYGEEVTGPDKLTYLNRLWRSMKAKLADTDKNK
jgi:hypothetical protein